MDFDINAVIFVVSLLCGYFFFKKSKDGDYSLEALGIAHEKPWPFVGNMMSFMTGKEGGTQFFDRLYQKFRTEKLFGFYGFNKTFVIMVTDPELIKKITIRDFDHFVNRDSNYHHEISDKYFGKTLLQLRDQKWKEMRTMLSPIYTASKLKMMFNLMVESAEEFSENLQEKAKLNKNVISIETRDTFARVTADGIATTALGFKSDCIKNKDSEMYKIAHYMNVDFANMGKMMLLYFAPKIYKFFNLQTFRKSVHEFFESTILGEIKRRVKNKITRPDVVQLLIQAKEGQLKHEKDDENDASQLDTKVKKTNWSDEDLVAQTLIFFFGGFDTTTSILQAMSYELAKNPEVQDELIEEVDEMVESLNGKNISFEQLNQMKYLEMVVNETLRKWPAFRGLSRHCTKDYELKDEETGKSWKIRKGTDIMMPFVSMCRDEKYFPDPEKFDPTRFNDENKSKISSSIFMPFGQGPRMCIASRYALLELKLVLFTLVSKFRIMENAKTPSTLTFNKAISGYEEEIFVDLKLRK